MFFCSRKHSSCKSKLVTYTVGILYVLFGGQTIVLGQHKELWGGVITNIQLNKKIGLWNDAHFVTQSFFIYRNGLTYTFSPVFNLTAGYAKVFTATPFSDQINRDENRLWGQVVNRNILSDKWMLQFRFRYDARYRQKINALEQVLLEEYFFYHRLRFFASTRYTIKRIDAATKWHLNLMNEFLYNSGKQVNSGMDQNRIYLLLGYTQKKSTYFLGFHSRSFPQEFGFKHNYGITFWWVQGFKWGLIPDVGE